MALETHGGFFRTAKVTGPCGTAVRAQRGLVPCGAVGISRSVLRPVHERAGRHPVFGGRVPSPSLVDGWASRSHRRDRCGEARGFWGGRYELTVVPCAVLCGGRRFAPEFLALDLTWVFGLPLEFCTQYQL